MKLTLTKAESKYIGQMYPRGEAGVEPLVGLTHISQLPTCAASLFIENSEATPDQPTLDNTIARKHLAYNNLPLDLSFKQWSIWLHKKMKSQPKVYETVYIRPPRYKQPLQVMVFRDISIPKVGVVRTEFPFKPMTQAEKLLLKALQDYHMEGQVKSFNLPASQIRAKK